MSGKKKSDQSVHSASVDEDQLSELKAMRLVIARKIDDPNTSDTALAALTRRLIEIGNQVSEMEAAKAPTGSKAGGSNVVNAESKFRAEAI